MLSIWEKSMINILLHHCGNWVSERERHLLKQALRVSGIQAQLLTAGAPGDPALLIHYLDNGASPTQPAGLSQKYNELMCQRRNILISEWLMATQAVFFLRRDRTKGTGQNEKQALSVFSFPGPQAKRKKSSRDWDPLWVLFCGPGC